MSTSSPSMIEGFLKKRAVKSGRNWKKRYFVLKTDGTLSYADKKGDSPKRSITVGPNTLINLIREGKEKHKESGFSVTGPEHSPLFLLAPDALMAEGWIRALNLAKTQGESAEGNDSRTKHYEAFASTNKSVFLQRTMPRSRHSRSDSIASTGSLPRSPTARPKGYTMRVGDKDMFVSAESWELYKDVKSCAKGEPSLGPAELDDLV